MKKCLEVLEGMKIKVYKSYYIVGRSTSYYIYNIFFIIAQKIF